LNGDSSYTAEHILLAEEDRGLPLQPGELVHHVNMVKLDNDPKKNLRIMNDAEHKAIHYFYQTEYCREHDEKGDLTEIVDGLLAAMRNKELYPNGYGRQNNVRIST